MALALLLGVAEARPLGAQQAPASVGAAEQGPRHLVAPGPEGFLAMALAEARLVDAHRLHGTMGLLAGAGGPVPASPSTAGRRPDGSIRWVLDAGLGVVRGNVPATTAAEREEGGPRDLLVAPRISAAAGVFEGFSRGTSARGIGALDLVAEARWLPVPTPSRVDGGTLAWGVGARVGVVRESFTVPAVTLVAMHRSVGALAARGPAVSVVLPSDEPPGTGEGVPRVAVSDVALSPRVTSLRGVVGKDLLTVGLSGGVQRDWIRGDAETRVGFGSGNDPSVLDGTDVYRWSQPMPVDRTTLFVGANRTWTVAQVAAEFGWSPRPAEPHRPLQGTFGPAAAARSAFSGALSFRITL